MAKNAKANYTKPELREKLKDKVKASDKGGKPGQWSARKAQLLAQEYKAEGGGYKGEKSETQKHLSEWTEEKWTTSDGKKARRKVTKSAKKKGAGKKAAKSVSTTTRYLPEKAWKQLTPAQKRKTNQKKQAGAEEGKQFVANTKAAKKARKSATQHRAEK